MPEAVRSHGLVLHVDAEGVVRSVLIDELGLTADLQGPFPFTRLMDASSEGKAENFLAAVRTTGGAVQWEMNIADGGAMERLEFSGVLGEDGDITVVAAGNSAELLHLYEDIVAVNNQQATMLRRLMKERSEMGVCIEKVKSPIEDVSRLNNELVNAQRQLASRNAQLREVVNEKDRLLGIAAHDLRNPLGNIVAFCEILADELKDDASEDVREILDIICGAGTHALSLVEDMLDFSRIESGQLKLERELTDVPALLRRRLGVHAFSAERKGIVFLSEFADDLPKAFIDPSKFMQVVDNLLTNAIKYSGAGAEVVLSCRSSNGQLELTVRDTGVGMTPKDIKGLFKPFVKGASMPTGRESSNGLGLYIVKRIVDGHGGTIDVRSTKGAGSEFCVRIPLGTGD